MTLYRLRLRQITEQVNARFDARPAERTRIARELYDTLLQSFHGLMIRFQAVHNMLPERPEQAKQSLDVAIHRAARAITAGRDAVRELRRTEADRNDFVAAVTALGQELATAEDGAGSPDFRVLPEGTPRALHPALQDDLYRISREAVANAFRHARATRIELDIRYDARMLRLRVRDDGIGMDPKILTKSGLTGHWACPECRNALERCEASLKSGVN